MSEPAAGPKEELPPALAPLFWNCAPGAVSLRDHADFVAGRVLSEGSWDAILWLRRERGDAAIEDYLRRTSGRLLSPRQLRLWECLLGLPHDLVTSWIERPERRIWDGRRRPDATGITPSSTPRS
jgi:hypothetical protein